MPEELLKSKEVCAALRIHVVTLRRWHAKGYGPPAALRVGRELRWYRSQVEQWLKEQEKAA